MIELKLTIDGKKQVFKKREMTIRDNIFAVKHQILATQHYSDEKKANDPDEYEKLQVNFAKTIAQIFYNEFTADQLLDGLGNKGAEILNEIYLEALGGTVDEDTEKK